MAVLPVLKVNYNDKDKIVTKQLEWEVRLTKESLSVDSASPTANKVG